jgi:hypothetical protein
MNKDIGYLEIVWYIWKESWDFYVISKFSKQPKVI